MNQVNAVPALAVGAAQTQADGATWVKHVNALETHVNAIETRVNEKHKQVDAVQTQVNAESNLPPAS